MSEQENEYQEAELERKWPIWWLAFPILLILSLCTSGYFYYKYYNATHAADGQSYEANYKDAVVKHKAEKADLNRQLEEITAQLQAAIENNTALQNENTDIKGQLDAKKIELAKKIRSGGVSNPKALVEARAEIEKLKSLQKVLENKSEELSVTNRELMAKVLETESSAEEAKNRAREMEEQKNVLDAKIKNSSLNVADLKVVGIRKKGSSEEETFKAFKTDKLKITFTILENQLVEPGNKEITVRILGTNKEVLTNDNDKLTDTDKLVTMVETVDFQGDAIKTTINYTQKPTYKKGTYTVELIHNEKLMGRASFILR
jgi:antitoxin component HigA of HigAB toxin-antitoxin module